MIHRIEPVCQTPLWQQALSTAFTDIDELFSYLQLDKHLLPEARLAASQFGLKIPREFAELIKKGDPEDPLLRQVLPLGAEQRITEGFVSDPVGDLDTSLIPGVLHKYRGRLLLIASGSCAVHCRYCFRRHFPYQESTIYRDKWQKAIDYIAQATDIDEIILSGGDPLTLSDGRLAELVAQLDRLTHLKRLRIHTRLPVVIPSRLTRDFRQILFSSRLRSVLVLHINHAREITPALAERLNEMKRGGITLLNQSVLLKGVNDCLTTLTQLSHALFEAGILPYYLHMLDKVQGAAHFEVNEEIAQQLQIQLRDNLPGYLVPKWVREQAGLAAKQPAF
ncbi:MAG: EF-P beta-lysylation protein EpmB [Sedimenticola sp.]|nr:EF-P beta-lysylation protein EpmB [Sedimenticola sp.]